jgi:hypothetical protein
MDIVDEVVRFDKIIELKRISLRIDDSKCFFEEVSFSFIRIFFFFIENSDENLEKFLVLDALENKEVVMVKEVCIDEKFLDLFIKCSSKC